MDYIRTFSEVGAGDVGIVGGKGANLGEMTQAGLPVPPGFCLTAAAYRAFVDGSGASEAIKAILEGMNTANPTEVEERSERIRAVITSREMPADIKAQVAEGYRELARLLGQPEGTPIPVAVRSSATAEDLPTASFAGQQDTYLNVRGEAELLEQAKRCWASLWTGRAVGYRVKQGFAHELVSLAVVVQAMIESEVSGVMFTANPVTGNRDEAVINASYGLGEAIVSGLVTPDTLTVIKASGAITSKAIASKDVQITYAPQGGTVQSDVPAERRMTPALSDEQVAQLGALSGRIEAHYKQPMDIEWGMVAGKFYILQARPITTLKKATSAAALAAATNGHAPALPQQGEYNRTMFVEIFPDAISPIFLSVIEHLFGSMLDFTFTTMGFQPPKGIPPIGTFYSQPYFNRAYLEGALQPLSAPVRSQLVTQFINPFGRHAAGLHGDMSPAFIGMAVRLLRFMTTFPKRLPGIVDRYRADIRAFEALDLNSMSDREIVDSVLNLAFTGAGALLNYDFLMIAMIGLTYQTLGTLLGRYYGDNSEEVRSKLISGVTGNVTMETNKRLWDLAQTAKRSPEVSEALRSSEGEALQARLSQTDAGRAFLAELQRFLKEYGHREVRMDIVYPTWIEDPTPILGFIRRYLDVAETQSPYFQQERLVKQREELATTVREKVRSDMRGRLLTWPIFSWVLKHTQLNTRERDTMHFEMTRLFPPFRHALQVLGQRWTDAGLVECPDDVYYITMAELPEVADKKIDMRETVRARRAELAANSRRVAPGIIRDGKAIDAQVTEHAGASAGEYRGIAGSPGTATGIARLVRGPEDFGKLRTGEILVAPLTNPVWTPLFAIAGGIVTEVGGILSHGAIVAREYGIPAVMGVAGVTTAIHDGQRVTVDGNRGVVNVAQERM